MAGTKTSTVFFILLLLCPSPLFVAAQNNNVNIVNFGTALFGSSCTVDNPSCSSLGYPWWCCPLGNDCTFNTNHDIVCYPNGMVCRDSLPYLGSSSNNPTSQQTVNVVQATTPSLNTPPPAATDLPGPQTVTQLAAVGINMGSMTNAQPRTGRHAGQSMSMVGFPEIMAVSLRVILLLL